MRRFGVKYGLPAPIWTLAGVIQAEPGNDLNLASCMAAGVRLGVDTFLAKYPIYRKVSGAGGINSEFLTGKRETAKDHVAWRQVSKSVVLE